MIKVYACLIGMLVLIAAGYSFFWPTGKKSTQTSNAVNSAPIRSQVTTSSQPLRVVGSSSVNLGAIPKGTEKKHTFEIRNLNAFTVRLLNATSSCKCTTARIVSSEIAPGGTGEVEVKYSANASPGSIHQSITLESDLPGGSELTLKIVARIEGGIVIVPNVLEVHERDGKYVSKGTLYRFAETASKEIDFSWSDDSKQSLVKFNRAERACTESEYSLYLGATNAIDFEVEYLDAYPHGRVDSSLRVQIDKQHDSLHTIRGAIGIDWNWIAGPNFDEGRTLLRIGRARKGEKKTTSLLLAIRIDGEKAPKIVANPSKDAPVLVEIGNATRRGKRFLYPVEITIPSDADTWWSQHLDRNLTSTIELVGDNDALSSISLRYEFSWE